MSLKHNHSNIILILFSINTFGFIKQKNKSIKIGLAAYSKISPQSKNSQRKLVPLLSLKYNRLRIRGSTIKYTITQFNDFKLGPLVYYGGHGFNSEFNARNDSLFARIFIKLKYLQVSFIKDVESVSSGSMTKISTRISYKNMHIIPKINLIDKHYVNYYYGVPRSTFFYGSHFAIDNITINEYVNLLVIFSYEKYSETIQLGSIVKRSYSNRVMLGIIIPFEFK